MTGHDTDDGGHSIEVKTADNIAPPADLPPDWLAVAMEPMPDDHIQIVEERIGWANINDLEDLTEIVDVLEDHQARGER